MKIRNIFYHVVTAMLLVAMQMAQGGTPRLATAQGPDARLYDEFEGCSLDTELWHFSSLVGGSYQVRDSRLIIHSGTVDGSGGTVQSNQEFKANEEVGSLPQSC